MRSVTFSGFKKQASSFINDVKKGEIILIKRHGKAVAKISPVLENASKTPSWKNPRFKIGNKGSRLVEGNS